MSVKVQIPAPLRPHTEGQDTVRVEGATVGDVLRGVTAQFPALADRVFDDKGVVRQFVNVYLNDEDIRYLDGLTSAVNAGDTVSLIPAVAGG